MLATYGMDNYDNVTEFFQEPLWESVDTGAWAWTTTGGRFGGGALTKTSTTNATTAAMRLIPEIPKTIFLGISIFMIATERTTPFIRFMDINGTEHANIQVLESTTTMNVNILGSLEGTFTVSGSAWHRLEFKLIVDDTVGEFTIRLDDTEVFSQTGINTQNGTNASVGRIQLQLLDDGAPFTQASFDDITIHDDQGTVNNDFLGDVRIVTLRPDGPGFATDFTPLAGTNWESVDETPGPDGDTSYVESSVAGHQDLYNVEDLVVTPSAGIVHSATVKAYVKKTDAGPRSIKMLTRSGGVTGVGAEKTILTDYTYVQDIVEINPDSGLAWTNSEINTIQIGMENT